MASGRKFGWKHTAAALGGGLAGAGVLLGLGKLGAPPVITSSIMGGMGLVGVGVTRGPVQTAVASSIGSSTVVLMGSALKKGREAGEKKEEKKRADAGEGKRELASKGQGKPRNNEIEAATLEAFDRMRASLAIDQEARAAA
ncbi:MAG: hypothetical protein HS109_20210 [Burkholderiales bacterium]|nr:hypothetical protein [Burkholderiales bacterium]